MRTPRIPRPARCRSGCSTCDVSSPWRSLLSSWVGVGAANLPPPCPDYERSRNFQRPSLIPVALVVPALLAPASLVSPASFIAPALEPDLPRIAIPWQFHPGAAPRARVVPAVVPVVVVIAAIEVVRFRFQHDERRKSRDDHGLTMVSGRHRAPCEKDHNERYDQQ